MRFVFQIVNDYVVTCRVKQFVVFEQKQVVLDFTVDAKNKPRNGNELSSSTLD